MAAPDQSFAPPAHMLATAQVLPGPGVTPAPAGGQGFALEPDGTIPASLQSSPLTGQVASAGTVTAGTGFSVNHSGTGIYDITFTTAFAAAPTVVVCGLVAGSGAFAQLSAVTATTATANFRNAAGTLVDAAFHFVAFATV